MDTSGAYVTLDNTGISGYEFLWLILAFSKLYCAFFFQVCFRFFFKFLLRVHKLLNFNMMRNTWFSSISINVFNILRPEYCGQKKQYYFCILMFGFVSLFVCLIKPKSGPEDVSSSRKKTMRQPDTSPQ